jgi:hypothetical protein
MRTLKHVSNETSMQGGYAIAIKQDEGVLMKKTLHTATLFARRSLPLFHVGTYSL